MDFSTIGDDFPYISGFLFCLAVALVSHGTGALYGSISPLIWAIVYGILIANLIRAPRSLVPGINFCANQLLKGTIAVMGLVISTTTLFQVYLGVINAILITFITLFFCLRLGRIMGLSDRLTTLIGIGMSICGSSAIAATAAKMEAVEEEIEIAIGCTTFFSLVSAFTYPLLFVFTFLNQWLKGDLNTYTLWVGCSIPDTSYVISAAGVLGFDNIGLALIIKLFRIFMISPAIVFLWHYLKWNENEASKRPATGFVLPIYGIIFIVNIFLGTFLETNATKLGLMGSFWIGIQDVFRKMILPFFLTTALAGVGSKLNIRNVLRIGARPLALAAILTFIVGLLALVLTIAVSWLM